MLKNLLSALTSGLARWMWPVMLGLALAASGLGYGWIKSEQRLGSVRSELAAERRAVERLQAARTADGKVLTALKARQAALEAENRAAGAALAAALARNPAWADQEVPPEVLEALK